MPKLDPTLEHGTKAMYDRHYRLGEVACDPCREAVRRKAAQRRAAGIPIGTKIRQRAKQRALLELSRMYFVEYHVLLERHVAQIEAEEAAAAQETT